MVKIKTAERIILIMNKPSFSIKLSSVLVKLVFILIIVCCIIAPQLVKLYDVSYILATGLESVSVPLLVTLYSCAVPAVILIIALDRLLTNIKEGNAFITQNVKCLRVISYCCFSVSILFIYFSFIRHFAFVIVIAAAFFGLILRVIKNVFEQAIIIREENDYTI